MDGACSTDGDGKFVKKLSEKLKARITRNVVTLISYMLHLVGILPLLHALNLA